MDRMNRAVILLTLVKKLRDGGSWCGETHIQKASYFLKEWQQVPFDFEFTLYKHGPYSFDIKNELSALQADALLMLEYKDESYGPSIACTAGAESLLQRFPNTIRKCSRQIDNVVDRFGTDGVRDLERMATALYVTRHSDSDSYSVEDRANQLHKLKPHISIGDAKAAVTEIDAILKSID